MVPMRQSLMAPQRYSGERRRWQATICSRQAGTNFEDRPL